MRLGWAKTDRISRSDAIEARTDLGKAWIWVIVQFFSYGRPRVNFLTIRPWRSLMDYLQPFDSPSLSNIRQAPARQIFKDGALLRPQTRRTRAPRSQPELRYLKSPPCQAALPLCRTGTFQLCTQADISTWLQHWIGSLKIYNIIQHLNAPPPSA